MLIKIISARYINLKCGIVPMLVHQQPCVSAQLGMAVPVRVVEKGDQQQQNRSEWVEKKQGSIQEEYLMLEVKETS